MDYNQCKKYFPSLALKIVGIIFLFFGAVFAYVVIMCLIDLIDGYGDASFLFYVFLDAAFIFAGIKLLKQGGISDEEYDKLVKKAFADNIREKGLNKLGIDASEVSEAKSVYFDGYVFDNTIGLLTKLGKDKKWRSNKYKVVELFFSENEVHCYTYTFMTTTEKHTELTDVYFYKDIVSVSTTSKHAKVGVKNIEYECFNLVTSGGTTLTVSLQDVDGAQQSVNAMRSLLREKKNS